MRLIDADKFAIEEPKLWDWSSVDGISSTAVLKQCIWDVQCAPIVHAIPIERIKKYMNEQYIEPSYKYNSLFDDWGVAVLTGLIEDWEKENE